MFKKKASEKCLKCSDEKCKIMIGSTLIYETFQSLFKTIGRDSAITSLVVMMAGYICEQKNSEKALESYQKELARIVAQMLAIASEEANEG